MPLRKLTVERSGSLREASPPTLSLDSCAKAAALTKRDAIRTDFLKIWQPKDVAVAIQVRMGDSSDMKEFRGIRRVSMPQYQRAVLPDCRRSPSGRRMA